MKCFKSILLKDPLLWEFWIALAFIVKGLFFIFLITKGSYNNIPGFWGSVNTDTFSYIPPLDNFFNTGHYIPDFRLPGYGIIYVPLLVILKKEIALNCLIIIQLILSSLTVYALALISKHIFKSNTLFYISYYLFLISIYSNMYDHTLASESLATSFLIFTGYFFLKWKETQKIWFLFLSGGMFTEAFFCRVIFIPIILIFTLGIILYIREKKKLLQSIFIFLLPFVFFDGLWVARNYYIHHKFIPLQTSQYFPGELDQYNRYAIRFLQSWGGNHVYWDSKAEIRWFGITEVKEVLSAPLANEYREIPSYIYTSQFNRDSLVALKNDINTFKNDTNRISYKRDILKKSIISRFEKYTASVKSEKPFLYYIQAPLSYLKLFFFQSGTSDLFNKTYKNLNIAELVFKIFYSLFYWAMLFGGLIGLILLFRNVIIFKTEFIIVGILLYISLIYPLFFRYCEYRYFIPAWPYLIICASYAFFILRQKIFPSND